MADGETFEFCKLAEKTHPDTRCGFRSDKPDEVCRDQVVSVELFVERTVLLGQIDRRANGGNQHQVIGIARNPDRNGARSRVDRQWKSSAVHLQHSLLKNALPACPVERDSKAADNTRGRT